MPRKKIIAEEKPVETPVAVPETPVETPTETPVETEVPATVSPVASPVAKKSQYRYPGVECPGVRVVPFNPGGDAENMYLPRPMLARDWPACWPSPCSVVAV